MLTNPNVVLIASDYGHFTDLVIWRESPDPNVMEALVQDGENKLQWKEFGVTEIPPPIMRLPRNIANMEFWQDIADALYKQWGIVPRSAEVHVSELEATQRHLEDFRRIVFGFERVSLERNLAFEPQPEQEENDASV